LGEETNGFLSQEKKSVTFSTMVGWGVDVTLGFQNPPLSLALSSRRGNRAKPLDKAHDI
jgi:hypothetical protein